MERARLAGRRFGLWVAEADRGAFSAFLAQVFATDSKQACEAALAIPGQPPRTVAIEATLSPERRECRPVVMDITVRKRMEDRQRLTGELLEVLNRPAPIEDTLRGILLELRRSTDLEAVGIRLREGEEFPYYASQGFSESFLLAERFLCTRDAAGEIARDGPGHPVLECMCGHILCGRTNPALPFFTESGSFWTNSSSSWLATTTEAERQGHTRNRCHAAGYESVALIPLRAGEEIIGLLQLNDHRPNQFTPERIHFFEGLGAGIGIALRRQQTEVALRNSEALYQSLVEQLPQCVFRKDREGRFTYANNLFCTLLGQSRNEILGKTDLDFFPPELARQHRLDDDRVLRTQEILQQVETSHLPGRPERVDHVLKAPVRHVLREIAQFAQETFPRSIQVQTEFAGDLGSVQANATQLHQVLLNLCVNARDAMSPGGGILLLRARNVLLDEHYVSMKPEARVGPYVHLQVSDTGCGIPDAIRSRIFEAFFSTKDVDKGTGLGLTTCLGIVKEHGGFIGVTSVVGQGTTFDIHLPAQPEQKQEPGSEPCGHLAPRGHHELVLLVDDEPAILKAVQRTLTRHGYQVICAGDGVEGMAQFTSHSSTVRVVVTDLMMPLMDGTMLCRLLQRLSPTTPVIVTTGALADEEGQALRTQLARLGIQGILEKPHTGEALLRMVHEALRLKCPQEDSA